jgi:hypothetical protein
VAADAFTASSPIVPPQHFGQAVAQAFRGVDDALLAAAAAQHLAAEQRRVAPRGFAFLVQVMRWTLPRFAPGLARTLLRNLPRAVWAWKHLMPRDAASAHPP